MWMALLVSRLSLKMQVLHAVFKICFSLNLLARIGVLKLHLYKCELMWVACVQVKVCIAVTKWISN
jgi:hypothetical protein